MFIKTMAVGPLEPAELSVTGRAIVALPRAHREGQGEQSFVAGEARAAHLAA